MRKPRIVSCPFCGSAGAEAFQETPSAYAMVICGSWKCIAAGPRGKTPAEAIKSWNKRKKGKL